MENNNHLVIMAGGVGSRFWPMSTPECPKQFIDVLGTGRTLLQLTVDRFSGICPITQVWVVTSKKYRDIVLKQLPGIPESNVLLEPCMRNTAPCIAYVAWKIGKQYPNANLVISPSDHIVLNVEEFKRVISEGLSFTANTDKILTLGMMPTRPETGYGYIKMDDAAQVEEENLSPNPLTPVLDGFVEQHLIPEPAESGSEIVPVECFKEKPDLKTAEKYLADGGYFWNAGIFMWNVNTIKQAFAAYQPDLADAFDSMSEFFYSVEEQSVVDTEFPKCKAISIDYAIMENATNIYVFPADFGWSDLGTWGSLYGQLAHDDSGNAVIGDGVRMVESNNCVVHVSNDVKMVLQGLTNCIVAEHNGVFLICKLEDEQRIKSFSETLK